ncbi:MAG: hypothetical protein IIC29_09470 [Chloroflexi bacterium]|nr:hypothetical protein [Chloroflexota bacterium]
MALRDMAGGRFDLPAYQLMGGRQRERVRLHLLLKGRNRDEWVAAGHHNAVLRQVPPSATMPRPRSRATA